MHQCFLTRSRFKAGSYYHGIKVYLSLNIMHHVFDIQYSIYFLYIIRYNDHFTWRKCISSGLDKKPEQKLWCHGFSCIKTSFSFKKSIGKYSFMDTWCTGYLMSTEWLWARPYSIDVYGKQTLSYRGLPISLHYQQRAMAKYSKHSADWHVTETLHSSNFYISFTCYKTGQYNCFNM